MSECWHQGGIGFCWGLEGLEGYGFQVINKYHGQESRFSSLEERGRAWLLAASNAASTAVPSQFGITCPNWHLIP